MPYNILIVDDDAGFREELCSCFYEFEFTQAGNGEEALKILRKPNDIDLVLLDVNMPGARGTDVLAVIKELNPALHIIILTGNSTKDTAIKALKARADDYIEKPFKIEETREIIKKILSKKDFGGHEDTGDLEGKIRRVKTFLERNCHKKVSLEDAAEIVGLNPKYLSRVFEEHCGFGFADYRTRTKIEYSKGLLKAGNNINQTSDKLGYENAETFIRAFKKTTGKTPTEFKKLRPKLQKEIKAEKKIKLKP
jgi:YesN/AraC family two-component response regulator